MYIVRAGTVLYACMYMTMLKIYCLMILVMADGIRIQADAGGLK